MLKGLKSKGFRRKNCNCEEDVIPTIINIPIPKNQIQEEEVVHVYPSYPFQYQPI